MKIQEDIGEYTPANAYALMAQLLLGKGPLLLPGAALTGQVCASSLPKGVPRAASCPSAREPAVVPRYPKEPGGEGCPAQSLIRLYFFQQVTWLMLDSHLRNPILQTPTMGPPLCTLCKLEYKSEEKAFLCLNKLL